MAGDEAAVDVGLAAVVAAAAADGIGASLSARASCDGGEGVARAEEEAVAVVEGGIGVSFSCRELSTAAAAAYLPLAMER